MATAAAARADDRVEAEIAAYLAADRAKSLLRFMTCGSVDDGKSTLIGRLLYDSKRLFQDQLAELERDSRRFGTQGEGIDFALLVDGLSAEREQGITIDVAYRFFSTDRRRFIVADAPGHVQYTRNMVTAASTASLAIILIDARRGVLEQTRRHSHVARLMGVETLVLAVNKMDLVGHDRAVFDAIVADYAAFARGAGIGAVTAIPMSALDGANVSRRGTEMPWYAGPTLIEALEDAPASHAEAGPGAALPVQWVNRPDEGFRGFAGTVVDGDLSVGDAVVVVPGGRRTRIARILSPAGDALRVPAGSAVTVTLADEVDCARGSVIALADAAPALADGLEADLVWMDGRALALGQSYLLKSGARTVVARVGVVDHVLDMTGGPPGAPRPLAMNDIGRATLRLDEPIAARPFDESRTLGAFILIDRETSATVAAGMIRATSKRNAPSGRSNAAALRIVATDSTLRAEAAARLADRFRGTGSAVILVDEATLRGGLCADVGADATLFGARVAALAALVSTSGATLLLDLDEALAPAAVRTITAGAILDDASPDWVI